MARRKHTAADTDYRVVGDGTQIRDGWRTPQPTLGCVRTLMGGPIVYDFCTDEANPTRAENYGTLNDPLYPHDLAEAPPRMHHVGSSTETGIFDHTFMNPPFSTRNDWVRWFQYWVRRGVLLVANETKCAWDLAYEHGWIAIRPRARIAFDLPLGLDVKNNKRPGGPSILFAVGYSYDAVVEAFPFDAADGHPGFTVWRAR